MAEKNFLTAPTPEQCTSNERLADGFDSYGNRWMLHACWYPQMGGYVGKCVVAVALDKDGKLPEEDGCFEAYIWHDGEFPFDDEDASGRGPIRHIHHCVAEQFIEFGEFVQELQQGKPVEEWSLQELKDLREAVHYLIGECLSKDSDLPRLELLEKKLEEKIDLYPTPEKNTNG